MINISRLYCGAETPGDKLRYGRKQSEQKPIVVWNSTRKCNLKCIHCYSDSDNLDYPGELSTEQAREMIEDLAKYGAPVLLFSGGEPFLRGDMFELANLAKSRDIRTVISTNGTMITPQLAEKVKAHGFSYVGISLDGLAETNDKFRGFSGCFDNAVEGIGNCRNVDQKVGLRFTITKHNYKDVPGIFDLVDAEQIPRICFYHLVYSGRGSGMDQDDIEHSEMKELMDYIIDRTQKIFDSGRFVDVLTVDNHTDAVHLYKRMVREGSERAAEVKELLECNGGNRTGIAIANVDNTGDVHPDQFWSQHTLGNIKDRPLSEIWEDTSDPLMKGLKDRQSLLKGKCAKCHYLAMCNGNFRARAEAVFSDPWQEDPACYLSEAEVTS